MAVAVGWRLEIGSVGGGEHWHQETFPSEIDMDVVCDMPGFVVYMFVSCVIGCEGACSCCTVFSSSKN